MAPTTYRTRKVTDDPYKILREAGPWMLVPDAGVCFGLGDCAARALARRGEFPVPVLRLGRQYRVATADVRRALGLPVVEPTTGGAGGRMIRDDYDLQPLDRRLVGSRPDHDGTAVLLGEGESCARRLLTGGEFARGEDRAWRVRWSDTISGHWWPLDARHVAERVVSAHMRPTADVPLSAGDVEAITARLCALLDARESAPTRTAPTLGIEAAVARRFARTWRLHVDRRGRLLGHPVADEASAALPDLSGRGIAVQARPRPGHRTGDVELTAAYLADHARTVSLLQRHERLEDWVAVVAEVRALVAR